jgi:hypothetical protein
MGAEARRYAELARRLPQRPDVQEALRDAGFAPYFLVNGLITASEQSRHEDRAFTVGALAVGLVEFADYFAALANRLEPAFAGFAPEEEKLLFQAQKRYFAYCISQLSEAGMGEDGVFMTMKGDALDQATSYAVRDVLEGGPDALAASSLFTAEEKRLWAELYASAYGDGKDIPRLLDALQAHFAAEYRLPFKKSPTS